MRRLDRDAALLGPGGVAQQLDLADMRPLAQERRDRRADHHKRLLIKAVGLGARACMAGRAYLYGLGAAGERGVDRVLDLLLADVRRTMALIGVRRVDDVTREHVG